MSQQSKRRISFKLVAAASALAVLMPFASVQAASRHSNGNRHTVYAKVIKVRPIYRQVAYREPVEQCWTEQEQYLIHEGYSNRRSHRTDNSIVGGVIGGVIGNQIGRNGNRGARIGATIAGAIVGSVIANEANGHRSNRRNGRHNRHHNHSSQHSPTYGVRPVKRCKTVYENRYEKRIDGYKVIYVHRGRRFKTRTQKHPGAHIQLNVNGRHGRRH